MNNVLSPTTGKIAKTCPGCGAVLVIRRNSATGEQFLGCSQYPKCKHSEPLPVDIQMRQAGAKPLPGFIL